MAQQVAKAHGMKATKKATAKHTDAVLEMPVAQDGQTLPDLVYQALLDAMFRGDLRSGDVISEFSIARQLGMSRTPVHIAIRDLSNDGLIVQSSRHRPTVSSMTSADLKEIFEMRILLEGEAAFRAASLMGRPTMTALRSQIDSMKRDGDHKLERWSATDDEFHEAIAVASGQKRLCNDILRYRRVHYALNSVRMKAELIPQALSEHEAVLDAIEARDGEEARGAMVQHLNEWLAYYVGAFLDT